MTSLGQNAFAYHRQLTQVYFGDYGDPIVGGMISSGAAPFQNCATTAGELKITYYYTSGSDLTEAQKDTLRASTKNGATVTLAGIAI